MSIAQQLATDRVVTVDSWLPEDIRQAILAEVSKCEFGATKFKNQNGDKEETGMQHTNNFASRYDQFTPELQQIAGGLKNRIALLVGVCGCRIQNPLLNFYPVGAKIGTHHDAYANTAEDKLYVNGNNVDLTCMITIQAPIKGGETNFPVIQKHTLSVNNCITVWQNLQGTDADGYGIRDENMLHEGKTVLEGEKYILVYLVKQKAI